MILRGYFTKLDLRAFLQATDGGSAIILAVGLSVVFGAAALAVDYARAITSRQLLNTAADTAALAAASSLPDLDSARRLALAYVEKNLPSAKFGNTLVSQDIEFGTWNVETGKFMPTNDGTASAVRVTTRMAKSNGNELGMLFAWVLDNDSMDVSASAVAGRGGPPCVLALDPTGAEAMRVSGTAAVKTIGCGVQVNSTATPALKINDDAFLLSSDICVGGSAQYAAGAASPEPTEYCPGISDPLAGLQAPEVGACDYHRASYRDSTATLDPGVYCGGLDISAGSHVMLSPGLYIVQDGPLVVAAGSSITGSGVTIFLTGKRAVVSFLGRSTIDLAAPTSGPMEGVLFFQDREFGGTHNWAGQSSTFLQGVIYFPSGKLASKSRNSITPEQSCVVLIADRLEFSANSGASIDITQSNCRNSLTSAYSRGIVLLQ